MNKIDRRTALTQSALFTSALASTAWGLGDPPRCALTGEDIEGPYYLPGAPRRTQMLEPGMQGSALELEGVLRDASCRSIANVMIELWQCDALGRYDARGMRLRSVLQTDSRGRWGVRTVVPGRYLNGATYRPAHVHMKVHGPRGVLTTQMYFPGSTANGEDGIYDPSLDLVITEDGDALIGEFTFVTGG